MSADLFAEFGLDSTAQSTSISQQQGTQGNSLIPDLNAADDADFDDFVSPEQEDTQQTGQSNGARRPYEDDNVLFDATLEPAPNAGADDWGDFEAAEPLPAPPAPKPGPDLLPRDLDLLESLSIESPPARQAAPKVSPKVAPKAAPKAAPQATSRKGQTQQKRGPITTAKLQGPEDDSFGDWGDFIDGPSTQAPRPAKPASTANPKKHEKNPSQAFTVSHEHVPASQVRPTNIPPPSVLLEFFPRVLDQLRNQATQTRKNPQQTDAVDAAASATITALKTAARVIAGRTLRWKRDTILSQSMRIGPARSGKPGGMKLSTINKNEDIKEQQQAVDVIALWRDRAALFSSIVQASGKKPVPVIADNIRSITASPEQGALKAPHACALCGLKRDERLPRVDEGVEDSFGEWWTDHWGHTDCRNFWEGNSKLLDQR